MIDDYPMDAVDPTAWDVAIIGGSFAGLSAALVLARARRRVLVLDDRTPRNRFAAHMHGVLGRDGHSPTDLVARGRREVRDAGGIVVESRAVHARRVESGFELDLEPGRQLRARRLIVATGVKDVLPDVPGLDAQWGAGVVTCPHCAGREASGRAIGVLLGSVQGIRKAHMLVPYSDRITVFTAAAGAVPDAEREMLERRGVRVDDRPVKRVLSNSGFLTGLGLADGTVAPLDVVFVESRLEPQDALLRQLGAARVETPSGSWVGSDTSGRSSVGGVWVVGNVSNPAALVPTAIGAGVAAALDIDNEIVTEEIAAAARTSMLVMRG